jgi:hypothetical protein
MEREIYSAGESFFDSAGSTGSGVVSSLFGLLGMGGT